VEVLVVNVVVLVVVVVVVLLLVVLVVVVEVVLVVVCPIQMNRKLSFVTEGSPSRLKKTMSDSVLYTQP
jgi:hypothetical protein